MIGSQIVVSVRLDGVLAVYDRNRGGEEIGRPVAGAKAFMSWLKELGLYVIVETGRRRVDLVAKWLDLNRIEYHTVNETPDEPKSVDRSKQVMADIFIGRRHVDFDGQHFVPVINAVGSFVHELKRLGDERGMSW